MLHQRGTLWAKEQTQHVQRGHTEHAAVIDDFKDQLLIALLRRLGGKVDIPIAEVDETGRFICSFAVCNGVFNFVLTEKH